MKKVLSYLMIAAVAVLICASCSKDGDDGNIDTLDELYRSKNIVKYGEKDYSVTSSRLMDYGDTYKNGTYSYGIQFILDGSDSKFVEIDILLAGAAFPEGAKIYNFSVSHAAGTMDAFFYRIGEDVSEKDGDLMGGSATVTKTGNTCEISFSATTPDGKKFSGYYRGTIK
ncbi:MAG: hypothetical protein LBK58_10155 [Prevotellaceae bacterium]|jgi:hypothetical protein|nr:hypothetical protein [Prevotellaceae bacterium]